MPVIRLSGRDKALDTLRNHLTELLFKELMGEATRKGPVVFEDPVAPGEIDVIVVWEAWRGLLPDDRTAVIREAYSRYSRTLDEGVYYSDLSKQPDFSMVPKVMSAIGATWNETVDQGLLSFSISPNVGPEEVDPDEVETIMLDSGAIETASGIHLRFPNARLASMVHARLMQEMPEAHWSINQEVGTVDDWSGR